MKFYWVNIGASYEEVRLTNSLWAPLYTTTPKDPDDPSKGTRTTHFPHWDIVAEVKQGDVIFCNYNRRISFIAIATKDAFQAPRPLGRAFSAWQNNGGRQVNVKLIDMPIPLSIDGYIHDMFVDRYNTQSTAKVFTSNGRVFQGYMVGLSPAAGVELLSLCGDVEEVVVDTSESTKHSGKKPPLNGTTKKAIQEARIGQGQFRQDLIDLWKKCPVSGVQNHALLIASHTLPWAKSTDEQRLDKYNGFLFAAHIDRLFDRGLISFDNSGKMIISIFLSPNDMEALGIDSSISIELHPKNLPYLEKHRQLFGL
jgi:putative restriction endonuclease